MSRTTSIHSAQAEPFTEFRAALGQRRPVTSPRPVDVILIGPTGQVGSRLAERLAGTGHDQGVPLVLREGINRSRHWIRDDRCWTPHARAPGALEELGHRLSARRRPSIVVDCTADPHLPRHYPDWLRAGIGVVTPNKHGLAGNARLYQAIQAAARRSGAPLFYSATVGAGLPILSTLRRMRQAGAVPSGLTAVLSGTLSHVFSAMATGSDLSDAVLDAQARGFTEPNPLEDLSGRDVARKLRIMLREAGLGEIDIQREPVVPETRARSVDGQAAVQCLLGKLDADWRRRIQDARSRQSVIVYLARYDGRSARVGPELVAPDSPFARLAGSGNRARIEWPDDPETPLDIFGPGAGTEVTAGAVLADLFEAASRMVR